MEATVAAALTSMSDVWVLLGEGAGGRAEVRDGITLMATGLPYTPCNQAIINGTEDADAAVATVVDFFSAPPLPFIMQVWHDSPAVGAAKDAGFVQAIKLPLMILHDTDVTVSPPTSVSIAPAEVEDLPTAVDVASECFEMEREAMNAFLNAWMLNHPAITVLLAKHDGAVIGTGIGVHTGDTVGVFNVSTLPRYRRRGIGEALTAACVRYGADAGARTAYLQASTLGKPVYERMGFVETGFHFGYMKKPAA